MRECGIILNVLSTTTTLCASCVFFVTDITGVRSSSFSSLTPLSTAIDWNQMISVQFFNGYNMLLYIYRITWRILNLRPQVNGKYLPNHPNKENSPWNLTDFRLSALVITLLSGALTARTSFRSTWLHSPAELYPPLSALRFKWCLKIALSSSLHQSQPRHPLASCYILVPLSRSFPSLVTVVIHLPPLFFRTSLLPRAKLLLPSALI